MHAVVEHIFHTNAMLMSTKNERSYVGMARPGIDVVVRYVYDEAPMLERVLWRGASIVLLGVLLVLAYMLVGRTRRNWTGGD